MNRVFLPSAPTFTEDRKDVRSNRVGAHARPEATRSGFSYSRMGRSGLFPVTADERRAHFRVSFRRTVAALVIAAVVLCGTIALIAAWTAS